MVYNLGDIVYYNGSLFRANRNGAVGIPGTSPDFDLVTVTGPTGATGDIGPTGPTGPAGPATAISPVAAVEDATDTTLVTRFNQLLANMRVAGLLSS